jgi:hypothetical protein
MAERSIAFMDFGKRATSPDTQRVGSSTENTEIIRKLGLVYKDVVRRLPKSASDLLDESLKAANVQFGRVRLVSRQPAPFSAFSAPIHKVMIAHALKGAIIYVPGDLRSQTRGGRRQVVKTILVNSDTRSEETVDPACHLVVRHASPANLHSLLDRVERNSLRLRQLMLADYIDTDARETAEPPPDYPAFHPDFDPARKSRFVKTRYALARDLMDVIVPGAYLTATAEGFVYEPDASSMKAPATTHIPVPRSLFRIPLAEGAAPRVRAL